MVLGRRIFLQRLGLAIAGLGVGDATLTGQVSTYQQALAQPAGRRLALLVGINQYPETAWQGGTASTRGRILRGCGTDVSLQRELLIHRFGFLPKDVITLFNEAATRDAILQTIQAHLVDQAEPGDTVVFHFSGLGSLVQLRDRPNQSFRTLVPVDGTLPSEDAPVIRDLFESTLAHRLSQVRTSQVTIVLDASSTPALAPLKGNLRVRSRFFVPTGDWDTTLSPPPWEILPTTKKRGSPWSGRVLRAGGEEAPALEADWRGYSAGVFTYALTQHLWTHSPEIPKSQVVQNLATTIHDWTGVTTAPQWREGTANGKPISLYGASAETSDQQSALGDGVLIAVDSTDSMEKGGTLWLGGIAAPVLSCLAPGARLRPVTALPPESSPPAELVVQSLDGLKAKVSLTQPLPLGSTVLETVRQIPRNLPLTIALDPALERIERVDATSALAGISYVATLSTGEPLADYLFGRVKATPDPTLTASVTVAAGVSVPAPAMEDEKDNIHTGYGLFAPDHTLLTETAIEDTEAVKTAVGRLAGHLQTLLAGKLLRLTHNPISSELPVRLTLETVNPSGAVLYLRETQRSQARSKSAARQGAIASEPILDMGQWQLRLHNFSQTPLYVLLMTRDKRRRLSLYWPPGDEATAAESEVVEMPPPIPPQGQQSIPQSQGGWSFSGQSQVKEVIAIVATASFQHTWDTLKSQGIVLRLDQLTPLPKPLSFAQAILLDLDRAGHLEQKAPAPENSNFSLKTAHWATLSLTI